MAAIKAQIVFDPPIEMDLGNNPGPVQFKKLSTFHEWLIADINFWVDLDKKMPAKAVPQGLRHPLVKAIAERNELKLAGASSVGAVKDQATIEKILRSYAEGRLLHSDTDAAAHIAYLADSGAVTELVYYYLAAGSGTDGLEIQTAGRDGLFDLISLLRASSHIQSYLGPVAKKHTEKMNYLVDQAEKQLAMIAVHASDAVEKHKRARELLDGTDGIRSQIESLSGDLKLRVSEALAPHEARIETALKEAKSAINKAQKRFDAASKTTEENLGTRMDHLEAKANERLDGFVQSAEDRHDFKAAGNFWGTKRARHLTTCLWFGGLFAGGIVVAVVLAGWLGPYYLTLIGLFNEDHELAITDFNIPLALFASLPVIGVFWILRQFLKLFLTNLAQYSDAAERIAMTETFLVLESAGRLKSEDRVLIIRALFRPGPSNDSSDGGMPANWFDILAKSLESKK